MTPIENIRQQIMKLECNLQTPCSVYMNLKTAVEVLSNAGDYPSYSKTSDKHSRIYGCRIIIHDDFPEPVVRPGAYVR